MTACLIALGSNLGDPPQQLHQAVQALRLLGLRAVSSFQETKAIGGPTGQARFANAAAVLNTNLSPPELIRQLQQVERSLGRLHRERWAARSLDLDLLLFGEQVIHQPQLQVPHPRMSFRPFVLSPAVEVAGPMLHPLLGRSLDSLETQLTCGEDVVAVSGATVDARRQVMQWIETLTPGLPIHESPDSLSCDLAPKLSIVLETPSPNLGGGPTLWAIPDATQPTLQQEVEAALQCVWPDRMNNRE